MIDTSWLIYAPNPHLQQDNQCIRLTHVLCFSSFVPHRTSNISKQNDWDPYNAKTYRHDGRMPSHPIRVQEQQASSRELGVQIDVHNRYLEYGLVLWPTAEVEAEWHHHVQGYATVAPDQQCVGADALQHPPR